MRNGGGERDDGSAGLHNDLFQAEHLTWKEEISARLHDYGRVFFSYRSCFFSRNRNLF
jgi:hypothetical protein